MSQSEPEHPSEEQLTDYALGNREGAIEDHVRNCPECARTVEETRAVSEGISRIPTEEVPSTVRHRILAIPGRKRSPRSTTSGAWVRMVALVGLGIALLVLFLYFFFIQLM